MSERMPPIFLRVEPALDPNRYPTRWSCQPTGGDICGYLDEGCQNLLFRREWYAISPSERRKLKKRTFIWVNFWDPGVKRRRVVWLPEIKNV